MYWREKSFYCSAQRQIEVCILIRKMVVAFAYKSDYVLHIQEDENYYFSNSEIYYKNTLWSAYRSNSSRTIHLNKFPLFVLICFISPFCCLILLSQELELHSQRRWKGFEKSWKTTESLFLFPIMFLWLHAMGSSFPAVAASGLVSGLLPPEHGRSSWGLSHNFELRILPLGPQASFCKQFSNVSTFMTFIRLEVGIRTISNCVLKIPTFAYLLISKAGPMNSKLDVWPYSRCLFLTFWRIKRDGQMTLGLLWSSSPVLQSSHTQFVKLCLQ